MPPKRIKPHEVFAIALDVGSTSSNSLCDDSGHSDLDLSKQLLDWVISRKIFTETDDEFSLIFFGHESTRNDCLPDLTNIYIYNEEYEKPKIDWLKVFENELSSNFKCGGDYASALLVALESLKTYLESVSEKEVTAKTVMLISNFAGVDQDNSPMELLESLAVGFKALNAQLVVVGPDLASEPKSKSQALGFAFINQLIKDVGGFNFTFRESLSQLKFFIPKQTQPRGQPFSLVLAEDFSIDLQMFLKNTETSMKFSFNPVVNCADLKADAPAAKLKKVRLYETVDDGAAENSLKYADVDHLPDDRFRNPSSTVPTARTFQKSDIARGYRYGQTLVPISAEEQKLIELPKDGKQLHLLQFTKRENILPQFLLSNCRYFLPKAKDDAAYQSLSALVKAMLEQNVVALCRYAYNVNSNPRVACLIPKISKNGYPVLLHYTTPFNEDLRNYEFPALEKCGDQPTEYQLDVVDEYITSMMLKSGDSEKWRSKNVINPKHQYQCQMLRHKALHPDEPFPESEQIRLLELVSPPPKLLDKAKIVIESVKDAFPLELNPYTKTPAFATVKANKTCVVTADTVSKTENTKDELGGNSRMKNKSEKFEN